MKLHEIIHFNPSSALRKGVVAPFIEMAALPTNARDINQITNRPFTGSGSKFENGDTLFARITPCLENGKGGLVSGLGNGEAGHGSTEFIVMRPKHDADSLFVYYVSRSPEFRTFAEKRMSGTSGRQRVSWQALAEFECNDLVPSERERVGSILGSLDDKIELNRRMNETLEAMAQAIFQDWFVDFGPTRRKLEGATDPLTIMGGLVTDPSRAQELADLFPGTLGDDGLPKGWRASTLGALSTLIKRGLTPKYSEDGVIVINQKCIRNGSVSLRPVRLHDASKRSPGERLLEQGDVLVNSTGVGTLGRVATFRKLGLTATADSHVTICRADTAKISKLMFALALERYQPDIEAMGHGSTGQTELSPHSLGALILVVPDRAIQEAFDRLVSPLRELVDLNIDQSVNLASTRDLLLPKLMSGEIQLRETPQVEPSV